jgi:NitT/TauT family transport system substrate-binding protein
VPAVGGLAAPLARPGGQVALPPRPNRPVARVTIGIIGTTSDVTFYAAEEKGWFDYMRIEPVYERFDSGGRNFTALATNQIDVGIGSPSVGLYNAIARGVTAKMVADRASSRAGFNSYQMFARKDLVDGGLLRDFADLRGKRIAVAATGTTADVVVGRALELGGLTLADAEILEMAYPDMAAAMATSAIDVGVAPEPSASLAVQRGGAVLWRASDFVPGQAASTMMYSAQLIAQQPDVARDFMVAFLLGARFYNDAFVKRQPEALNEALDMIARRTGLTDRDLLQRVQVGYIDPNGALDRQALAADYEWFRQNRGLTATVDLSQAVDDSFANYAVSVLGTYR